MSAEFSAEESECDVLFFVAAGRTYAADPRDVLRVDRPRLGVHIARIAPAEKGARALIVQGPGHEVLIPVASVTGVRRTPRSELRPVPGYLAVEQPELARELLGMLVREGTPPILVLDLKRVSERAIPPEARTDTSHGQDHRFG